MSYEKLKTLVLVTLLFVFISASCLLAYKNRLLQSDVAVLWERLQAKASEFRELESQYRQLLEMNSALNMSYAVLEHNYTRLSGDFERLMADYVELAVAYAALNKTYAVLLQNYTVLKQQVEDVLELQSKYEDLLGEYQTLLANYTALKVAYGEACFVVYRPLWSNETIKPSISELMQWLMEDDTDSLPYSKWDFVCGDFAVMLSMRAKMKHWDMGIVAVLGRDAYGNEFNHAFNAIRCVEGLVYVEPQNDQVFYGPISEGQWYNHPGFGRIYVETFIIVVLYQPPL
ncbi:MAG: hypothetical protein NZ932_02860 [Candidatus Bathyarchaeota archaeon]|nr:hypothetical protein [Candidatus Bathyarchaeota archaeon]MDW8022187.1 hypothetical protein [Nitrososphaerota archaeon]MDW8041163.1 hypothetical protein [Nitrososphaerota archaeon]